MTAPEPIFDRQLLQRRRLRAARMAMTSMANQGRAGGGLPDFLLRRAVDDIVWRLSAVKRRFATAVVLGGHHGLLAQALQSAANVDAVIETEASQALLDAGARLGGKRRWPTRIAEEERLPFEDGSVDLVVSALSLQWVDDLPGALVQIRRALKPDGLMLAALVGGRTLFELREAFLLAEAELEGGASPRVAPFADVRDLGSLLQRARFALPVTDVDPIDVTYPDPIALMRDLRAMGAGNVLLQRRRVPLRRATLARAIEHYRERHATPQGRIKATFEIVTLTGWAPHESQPKPLAPGSARTRLADALGTREQPAGDPAGPPPKPR